jgi:hypothetical protein
LLGWINHPNILKPAIETAEYEKNYQRLQLPIMVALDLKLFVLSTISIMFLFGMRHALDVDHITAIDKNA